MNVKKEVYFCIILTLFCALSTGFCQNVLFTVTPEKSEYLIGEPIWVHVSLKNNGPFLIKNVNWLAFIHGLCLIIDSSETPLRPQLLPYGDYTGTVQVDDSLKEDMDIQQIYFNNPYGDIIIFGLIPPRPGKYTLYLNIPIYFTRKTYLESLEIESNRIHFLLSEPQGIEYEAFQLMCQGTKLENQGRESKWQGNENLKSMNCFTRLIDSYPKSVYVESAFHELLSLGVDTYFADWPDISLKYSNMMLDRFPNSHYIGQAISACDRVYAYAENYESALEYLESIMKYYSDTRAAEQARWRYEQMRKLGKNGWLRSYRIHGY